MVADGDTDFLVRIESIYGSAFDDEMIGSDVDNYLIGREGHDILIGYGGNDRLDGNSGDDRIDGGAGFDLTSFADATQGINVDLPQGTASGLGADSLTAVEDVYGSFFDDTITGDGQSNWLSALLGDDVVSGGAGNDLLWAGDGTDRADGGEGGDDVCTFAEEVAGCESMDANDRPPR